MSKDEKEKSNVVLCSHCGRPLAEIRGNYEARLESHCPDCQRTTRYYGKSLDNKPLDVVLNR